jgi:hypothetical protein
MPPRTSRRDPVGARPDLALRRRADPGDVIGVERHPLAVDLELAPVVTDANSRFRLSGDRRVFDLARAALTRLEAELPA